jgi:peptidoglycan-associated lipoprotein
MRISIRATFFLLLGMTVFSAAQPVAHAQHTAPADKQPHAELALGYTFTHSNAPPGGCICFNLNGGNATFAWPIHEHSIAIVGDVSVGHAGNIATNGYNLTLSTFTAGARYQPHLGHSPLKPFGQVLVGVAHAGGSLVAGQDPSITNSGAAFAAITGGGLDLRASRRFSLRLFEADYLVTTFDNGVNDHQNNLRISTGVVLHF